MIRIFGSTLPRDEDSVARFRDSARFRRGLPPVKIT